MLAKVAHAGAGVHPLLRRRRGCTTICSWRARLRAAGIGVEVYPEPKKLGQQLKYADRRGFRVALIAGENEFAAGQCQVKKLATGESVTVSLTDPSTRSNRISSDEKRAILDTPPTR